MNDYQHLRVLLADDEKPIANLYKVALPTYFVSKKSSEISALEDDLFGSEEESGPSASATVCSQGAEAVEQVRTAIESGEPYDVVVLDIRMPPGINGVEAAAQIRTLDSEVPIIFVSGYSDYALPDLYDRIPPPCLIEYIEKPIQLAQLADRIRESVRH